MKNNKGIDDKHFDVIGMGGFGQYRYIFVFYKGHTHMIPAEKLLPAQKDTHNPWFTDAKYVSPLCSEEEDPFFMPNAIGWLTWLVHENNAVLPIRNIDISKLREIANASGEFEAYLRTFIKKADDTSG